MTAGEGLADSILYLVDTILHLREPSHAPACPTPGCPSHRPRPALHPPRLAQRIAKSPRDGALRVTPVGLEGDEQGDLRVHGGIEKAIHHYPREHYAAWIAELGEHPC